VALAGQLLQEVPEALVRQALAEQFGCTAKEVTEEQISFQVSRGCKSFCVNDLL